MTSETITKPIIRILIANDHPVVREGLHGMLTRKPDLFVVGEATDGVEAVAQALRLQPDVILLNLVMPRKNALAAIREIRDKTPTSRILVMKDLSFPIPIVVSVPSGPFRTALHILLKSFPNLILVAESTFHHQIERVIKEPGSASCGLICTASSYNELKDESNA